MPNTKRRLAAVMFTDIVDYSKLMNADESKAMELLNQHDKIAEDCFSDYNGKLIKKIGDADFIEFSSTLDAVKCAINLQDRFKKRNQTSENIFDEIHIRIGIHVGDIIEKEDDIFGDGVNIASRIVSIANGGEICISKEANASIQGQKEILSASIGSHNLKNIVESWDLYRIFVDKEDYSSWAESNYSKQLSFRNKASKLKKYLSFFIILFILIVNIPIAIFSYSEWSKRSSIKDFSKDLELVLSSTKMLDDKVFIKTNPKDIYLSVTQAYWFPSMSAKFNSRKPEIKNFLTVIIELMNRFDGYIEVSTHTDDLPVPPGYVYSSSAHLSSARSATIFSYLINNGLNINKIKFKSLFWGKYKPYSYINSKVIPTDQQIFEANQGKNRKETKKKRDINRRIDFHFFYR